MNLVFLGPPGSGKGTQAVRLANAKNMIHLSTGDILREDVKNGTELGKKAESYMKSGNLVPDELIIGLIEKRIAAGELSNGFILDGFPRTIPQAEALKVMLKKNSTDLNCALLLKVSDEEIIKRLSGRWHCSECNTGYNYPMAVPKVEGVCDNDNAALHRRHDDEEAVVRNRLKVYKDQTQPIEDFYRDESILAEIAAEDSPDNVFEALLGAVA